MSQRRLAIILIVVLSWAMVGPVYASTTAPDSVAVTSTSVAGTVVNQASARVTWNHSGINVIGFVVRYRIGTGTPTSIILESSSPREANVSNLSGGQSYSFTVSAVTAGTGTEAVSGIVSFEAKSIPSAPSVVSASSGKGQVTLKWNAAEKTETGGLGITSYVLQSDQGNIETVTGTTTEKTISGLTNGSSHTFNIRAINSLGQSQPVNFEKVSVYDVPGAPTGVTLEGTSNTLTSTWSAPTLFGGTPITEYQIFLVSVATGLDVDSKTTEAATRTVDFTNVANGTYRVEVVAVNDVGRSTRSSASVNRSVNVSATLQSNTPIFSPSGITSLQVDGTLRLRITTPSGDTPTVTLTPTPTGACTYVNDVLTAIYGGSCAIRATVSANSEFAAGDTTVTLVLTKLSQTITFALIEDQLAPGTISLSAVSSSLLSPSYSASGSCSVSGSTLTTQTGDCVVTASQSGNLRYDAATSVSRAFTIRAASTPIIGGGGFVPIPSLPTIDTRASTLTETRTVVAPTIFRVQVVPPAGSVSQNFGSSCVEITTIGNLQAPLAKKCGESGSLLDFTLENGNYLVLVSDPANSRKSKDYTLTVRDGVATVPSLAISGQPPRFQLAIGELIRPAAEETGTVVTSKPETATTARGETSTSQISPSESDSRVGSTENSKSKAGLTTKPKVRSVPRATSSLPSIDNSLLHSKTSARNLKRVTLLAPNSSLSISKRGPLQLRIPIDKKSALVTIRIQEEGKSTFNIIRDKRVFKGNFDSHLLQFKRTGNFIVTIVISDKKSRLNLRVKS